MTRFGVRVQPGARRAGITGRLADGTWKVAVTAPPEGGRANAAVAELLAAALGVRPRQVRVTKGLASRSKRVEVDELNETELVQRLAAALAAAGAGEAGGKARRGE